MVEDNTGGNWNKGHVDAHTLKHFYDSFDCKSILDIGCGTGLTLSYAKEKIGYEKIFGLEGHKESVDNALVEEIHLHDFEKDCQFKFPIGKDEFDLGWCVSVAEHIEEKHVWCLMDAFTRCKHVVFTGCPPGYPGYHHVNCHLDGYWREKFDKIGYELLVDDTRKMRKRNRLMMTKEPWWREGNFNTKQVFKMYIKKWGLIFRRRGL